ncbi:tRNA (adenosine(37)-N6)-threonylcarbamoyltransferase complex dimerization subunit type 1 TsaB [Kozakia baliensis]|uniref:tRNA (adenosine(37)-N6)-threonylcarbamoyltransferase complex dimerization subunit type 1 TsaB n=1 Tax=Kozakia baliensis TaxID=153496 RepID=UPI001F024B2C|nr:tRNA (adenosine(37)-N6)-threonylcarbamoyltransferase complex dimerization subunit type 1 TsaB [Kozakia baliensis]
MSDALKMTMPNRILVLNGAAAGEGATGLIAVLNHGTVVAQRELAGRGAAEHFAPLTRELLRDTGWSAGPELIVAVTGPGSFTGLRASLALATGLALGFHCRLRGVTVGAALRSLPNAQQAVSIMIARRNRCFVEDAHGGTWACSPEELALPHDTAVMGDGVASLTDVQRANLQVLPYRFPTAQAIVEASVHTADLSVLEPVYIDAPEAKLPAAGLRSAPK